MLCHLRFLLSLSSTVHCLVCHCCTVMVAVGSSSIRGMSTVIVRHLNTCAVVWICTCPNLCLVPSHYCSIFALVAFLGTCRHTQVYVLDSLYTCTPTHSHTHVHTHMHTHEHTHTTQSHVHATLHLDTHT